MFGVDLIFWKEALIHCKIVNSFSMYVIVLRHANHKYMICTIVPSIVLSIGYLSMINDLKMIVLLLLLLLNYMIGC